MLNLSNEGSKKRPGPDSLQRAKYWEKALSTSMGLLKNYNFKKKEQHPFHLVDPSPWPIMTSISLLCLTLSFISFFHYYTSGSIHFIISLFIVCFYLFR